MSEEDLTLKINKILKNLSIIKKNYLNIDDKDLVEHNKFKLIYDIYDMEMDGNPSKVIWGNRGGMISPDYNNQVMLTKYHLVRGSYKVMKYMGDKRCLFINWMNKNPLGVKQ